VACLIPDIEDELLPKALQGVLPKTITSGGGVAAGVTTEGMGYAMMVEGMEAVRGSQEALSYGLAFMRSWLAMVYGPLERSHPLGGGHTNKAESATKVDVPPYGVSAIPGQGGLGPSGVASWRFPLDQSSSADSEGSATDGDQDAVLGMIYLTAALGYPADFVDVVMRAVVAFTSADLGFPDLYRTLPSGEKVFTPKGGSYWGGLLPTEGRYRSLGVPWCYAPGYFSPGHYRIFRDFAALNWNPEFDGYLPPHQDGSKTAVLDLVAALDSAVTAGYNLLYYSSCESGSVSNWVGAEAECEDPTALNCAGVPRAHTPYVGAYKGTCAASETRWGAYGADASRAAWRIAFDYVLYREDSERVTMYDRDGNVDKNIWFNARVFLNRIVRQYKDHADCDGANLYECMNSGPGGNPWRLAVAYDHKTSKGQAPDVTCDHVPNQAESWWAGFMAYPTFAAFVAPYAGILPEENAEWMNTFASICNFEDPAHPNGTICHTTYFDLSQALIATMVMAERLSFPPVPSSRDKMQLREL
jgi:hypothetical protein